MNLELNVVRFENEDVIATSCTKTVYTVEKVGSVYYDLYEGSEQVKYGTKLNGVDLVGYNDNAVLDLFPKDANWKIDTTKIYHWDSVEKKFDICKDGCNEQ